MNMPDAWVTRLTRKPRVHQAPGAVKFNGGSGGDRRGLAVLKKEIEGDWPVGRENHGWNNQLYASSKRIFELVAGGHLADEPTEAALVQMAIDSDSTWDAEAIRATVASGRNAGLTHPRVLEDKEPSRSYRGQYRMAQMLIAAHGDRLRYAHGLGWLHWTGTRWQPDQDAEAQRAVKQTIDDALDSLKNLDGTERTELFQDVKSCESAAGTRGVLEVASAWLPVSVAAARLDADPYLFNTDGGTFDLSTETTRPHSPADLISRTAPHRMAPGDGTWETFLRRVLPDEVVRGFVQRLLGYAMSGEVTEHVMPMFTGPGANGKGTLRDAILWAFGDYATEVDPALLMASKHPRHATFLMELRGRRLVFCSETRQGGRIDEPLMKRLTGGDPIQANRMRENPVTFQPSHTLVMLTNNLPRVDAGDEAVRRRMLVVPFDVVIPVAERDGTLPGRLRQQAPAVLSWIHEGWRQYRSLGLDPPPQVRVRTEDYLDHSDPLGIFLEEHTVPSPNGIAPSRPLYLLMREWCSQTGEWCPPEREFIESLRARGHALVRTTTANRKTIRGYRGIGIRGPGQPQGQGTLAPDWSNS